MKLKCVKEFFDKEENVRRNVDDVFDATAERAAQIRDYEKTINKKYVEEVQEPPEQQQADETQTAAQKGKKAAGEK